MTEKGLPLILSDDRIRLLEAEMNNMTDKQMQFIAWLITTATDKCQTMDEVRELNKEIRKRSTGLIEEIIEEKRDE